LRAHWPKDDVMNSTTCERSSVEELGRDCCIRGYHVDVGGSCREVLECVREPHNVQGRYAVSDCEKKSGTIVGHLPRRLLRVCSLFLQRGGMISCTVTGGRRYSVDLYITLNFRVPVLLCTKAHVLFLYRKLSLF